jgi:hypothetical protein
MREAVIAQNNVLAQQQGKSQEFKHGFSEKDPFIETEGQIAVR